jgi:kynurenine formamidase
VQFPQSAAEFVGLAFHGPAVTHIDALNHVHDGELMYNGFRAAELNQFGSEHLTVEPMAAAVSGRGVLLDLPRTLGVPTLDVSVAIKPDDLDRAAADAGVEIEPGDIVFVRTGTPYTDHSHGTPGLHASSLRWIHRHDVAAIGSDVANDVAPSTVPVHRIGIAAMGLALIDNCDLGMLADTCGRLGRNAFLCVVSPARTVGGTGWPVNPLAFF